MNKNINSIFRIVLLLFILNNQISAQVVAGNSQTNGSNTNSIVTAVPFLKITPDARTGSMGNAGVATQGDANSASINPAKLAMIEDTYGVGISYSPWLRKIANDISISYLAGFIKIDERNTVGASIRYFSLGDIQLTDGNQQIIGISDPNEFAFDLSYARKFSEEFSLGTSLRYISSNITSGIIGGSNSSNSSNGLSVDIGALYSSKSILFGRNAVLSAGLNLSNIGSKMSDSDTGPKYFLPTNLKLGGAAKILLDDYSDITFALDFNKLLVPTQPIYDTNGNILNGRNPDRSVTSALLSSLSDAPDGFSEELKEIGISTGVEYWYNNTFSLRGGYNYENKEKGNASYLTLGLGLKYQRLNLDFGYILADVNKSPLANTLRFGLKYTFTK